MIQYASEVTQMAARYKLNPDLILAQVQVESGGDTWAWNPEPRYPYLWDVITKRPFRPLTDAERSSEVPPVDFRCLAGDRDQEWWGQQASWGLMQIMGAVAREHGFAGSYMPELCDPISNLSVGCNVMSELLTWAKGDYVQAFAAYNGGRGGNATKPFRNQAYADKIMAAHAKLLQG